MRFRFTLIHRGSETEPISLPALSLWSTNTGSDEEWATGPMPSVTLPGSFPPTAASSEYLWVDYGFVAGNEYSITLEYNVIYNSGSSNPRTVLLAILDNSFVTVFSESEVFPITPGGNGSVTVSFTADSDCRKIGLKITSGSNVGFTVTDRSGTGVDTGDETTSLVINEPDGWKQAVLKLARDKEFYSVIEFFDGSFIFYGDNGVINGGIHFIKDLEQEFGPDVAIEILIELAPDDENYETVFNGQLDLSLAEELPKNKIRIPIIRDNFWAKFNSRWQTPVDLQAFTDLDGAPIDPVETVDLNLPAQKIRYVGEYNWQESETYSYLNYDVYYTMQLDWDETVVDDLKKFSLTRTMIEGSGSGPIESFGIFEAPYDGEYTFDIAMESATYIEADDEWRQITSSVTYYLHRVGEIRSPDNEFLNDTQVYGVDSTTISTFNKTIRLGKGEQVVIYGVSLPLSAPNPLVRHTVFGTRRLQWKTAVDLATTGTVTLSGEQNIDGTLTSLSDVLVKNQGNPEENGIYTTGTPWTRRNDADTMVELIDAAVYVTGGTTNTGTAWRQDEVDFNLGVNPNRWLYIIPSDERLRPYPGTEVINFLHITADTTFKNSISPAFLVHDAAAAILKSHGLGEENPFYSELLGSSLTNARQYEQDGCGWKYALLKGLQLRGYELSEKPFFSSFENWWKGINPILCLGLTYEIIGGISTEIEETELESVDTWSDAAGPEPGTWDYGSFGYPAITINGSGGPSGYTVGDCITVAGTYEFTTLIEIENTGGATPDIVFTWAILDAGFNEIVTRDFIYSTYGFHLENFTLTPPIGGVYFAVKAVNNTPVDSKTVFVRYVTIGDAEQIILNDEFDDSSIWTNEGSGTLWSITGGELTLSLASGTSRSFTQEFLGTVAGHYVMITERTLSDITFPADTLNLIFRFLDEDDNVVASTFDFGSANATSPLTYFFTTVVPITKVEIVASINSGAGIDVAIPFFWLYTPTGISDVDVPQEQIIRVEEREHFYNPEMAALISNIENITRKYDNEKIYKKIEIGYGQWQSEDISGIDDTQTKQTRATRFEKIGTTIQIYSDFIAASLAIETTRRQTIEKSKDYKFDNNTFIIAINPDDVSPDSYLPELDENFASILNLLNSDTRYNTRISVARNFLRWRKWLNGCLQHYINSFYKFVGAEGNFDMISDMNSSSPDCLDESYDDQPLSEKQDIEVTSEIIHTPNHYEFEVPMEWETYKTIRENRKNAIGISLTDSDHVPLFIDQLDYEVMNGKAKIMGWTKEYFDIRVIEGGAATQICLPSTVCENPITDEFAEILTDENGVCITV